MRFIGRCKYENKKSGRNFNFKYNTTDINNSTTDISCKKKSNYIRIRGKINYHR